MAHFQVAHEHQPPQLKGGNTMWLVSARFKIGDYELPELDLTAPLAIGLIFGVAYCLMLQTPVGG